MGKVYYASGQSVTLSVDREKAGTPRILSFIDAGSIKLNKTTYFKIGNAVCGIDQDTTIDWANLDTGSEESGKDYFVYVCLPSVGTSPVVKISLNATYPQGYTADNSRKIGGFHNNPDGDILEHSIWDLKHRPACPDPTGMVYDPGLNIWVDIYLGSDDGNNGIKSTYGSTFLSKKVIELAMRAKNVGKFLPSVHQFLSFAAGTPGAANADPADPTDTGGHQTAASQRLKSAIGIEDAAGVAPQVGREPIFILGGSDLAECKAFSWINPYGLNGQMKRQGSKGLGFPCYGFYNSSQEDKGGPRCLVLDKDYSHNAFSARGIAKSLEGGVPTAITRAELAPEEVILLDWGTHDGTGYSNVARGNIFCFAQNTIITAFKFDDLSKQNALDTDDLSFRLSTLSDRNTILRETILKGNDTLTQKITFGEPFECQAGVYYIIGMCNLSGSRITLSYYASGEGDWEDDCAWRTNTYPNSWPAMTQMWGTWKIKLYGYE